MKILDLNEAAESFEMINSDNQLFYNIETGEFDVYIDPIFSGIEDDEKFEEDYWVTAPNQRDLDEYRIMEDFAESVSDLRKNELLYVALQGRGAFRRFKDTLYLVELVDEWYAFKHRAFVEIAKEWCETKGIPYEGYDNDRESQSDSTPDSVYPKNVRVIPLVKRIEEDAARILHDVLKYSKHNATQETRRMMSSNRIALAAIADIDDQLHVVGIIGAIPQYGVTGWELHPLAVSRQHQRHGIGRLLVETLEVEVAARGCVTLYLGSDDEDGTTSLYGTDLYDDTFNKIMNIENIDYHPYEFYEKMGYKIVGVIPDANGIGKPDIWMAKHIKKRGRKQKNT